MWKSRKLPFATSVISAYRIQRHQSTVSCWKGHNSSDQVEHSLRVLLIFSSLCEEKETLPCLGGVRSIWVGNVLSFLVVKVCCKVLVLQGSVAEPKVFLGEEETPGWCPLLAIYCRDVTNRLYVLETCAFVTQNAFIDRLCCNRGLSLSGLLLSNASFGVAIRRGFLGCNGVNRGLSSSGSSCCRLSGSRGDRRGLLYRLLDFRHCLGGFS